MTGFVDPSAIPNYLRGGNVKYLNQAYGATGVANNGSTTTLYPPNGSDWEYACIRAFGMVQLGIDTERGGGHDFQALDVMMNAGAARTIEALMLFLDAAYVYGMKMVITLGGLSDPNTWQQGKDIFVRGSAFYNRFVAYAAAVADGLRGHPSLSLLELLNEPDFMAVIKGYWLPLYQAAMKGLLKDANGNPIPADPYALVNAFCKWQDDLIGDVKAAQKKPGVPIGMGTALDSTVWCDSNGNPRMDWLSEKNNPNILKRLTRSCDKVACHLYKNNNAPIDYDVLVGQKLPAFAATASVQGKELILGECGDLWIGGTYDAALDQVYKTYTNMEYCWMVRWWDPKLYNVPSPLPARPSWTAPPIVTPPVTEPEPVDPPVVTPPPVDVAIEPADPSSGDCTDGSCVIGEPTNNGSNTDTSSSQTPTETPSEPSTPTTPSDSTSGTQPTTPAQPVIKTGFQGFGIINAIANMFSGFKIRWRR